MALSSLLKPDACPPSHHLTPPLVPGSGAAPALPFRAGWAVEGVMAELGSSQTSFLAGALVWASQDPRAPNWNLPPSVSLP